MRAFSIDPRYTPSTAGCLHNMRQLMAASAIVYGRKTVAEAWRKAGFDMVLIGAALPAWLWLFVRTGSLWALILGASVGGAVILNLRMGTRALVHIRDQVELHDSRAKAGAA